MKEGSFPPATTEAPGGQARGRDKPLWSTPRRFPEDETFDVGQEIRTPLALALAEYRYDLPSKFTRKINKLTVALDPEPTTVAKP